MTDALPNHMRESVNRIRGGGLQLSDLEQAIDRLSYAIQSEEDRKIVFLTGSALSAPNVPNTGAMVQVLLADLGADKAGALRAAMIGLSESDQYLKAASELQKRRGDRGLAAAIVKGVKQALRPGYDATLTAPEDIPDHAWSLPDPQRLLGQLFARIPPQQAGAVVTTNFDPLTEVAFRLNGISAAGISVPGSTAFPIDAIYGPLPILHLHGFWEDSTTLSTALQLDRERPLIERMITRLLDKAILVVMGYGGWNDSFTRALSQMIAEGHTTSLQTEIMWLNYGNSASVQAHPLLRQIEGHAGVNIYNQIPAVDFLEGVIFELESLERIPKTAPLGWTVPPQSTKSPSIEDLRSYVEGAEPDWHTVREMPMLQNALHAYEAVRTACADSRSGTVVLSGPAGEGKTTALLQVAQKLSGALPDANILLRRPGAPEITAEWLDQLASSCKLSVLFIDNADLIIGDIHRATTEQVNGSVGAIVWVLSVHTSYLRSPSVSSKLVAAQARTLEFQPFSNEDARSLADAWQRNHLLPSRYSATSTDLIGDMVREAGEAAQGRSLFGSVLHLWGGEDLVGRVTHMLAKVARLSIAGVGYGDLLSGVALTQVAWDPEGEMGDGLSIAALGFFANTVNHDIVRLVVEPLGREVGLSQVGDRVYMRHPALAQAIVDVLREEDRLDDVAKDLSRVGSAMRFSRDYSRDEFNSLYMLSRRLQGREARAAAMGAVLGAPDRLEPRVTAIASMRDNGSLQDARRYALKLNNQLGVYVDRSRVQRGFLVEWSVVESRLGDYRTAISIAIRAISDQVQGLLSVEQLQYGLVNIANAAEKLATGGVTAAQELRTATGRVLHKLPAGQGDFHYLSISSDNLSLLTIERDFRLAAMQFASGETTFRKMNSALASEAR